MISVIIPMNYYEQALSTHIPGRITRQLVWGVSDRVYTYHEPVFRITEAL